MPENNNNYRERIEEIIQEVREELNIKQEDVLELEDSERVVRLVIDKLVKENLLSKLHPQLLLDSSYILFDSQRRLGSDNSLYINIMTKELDRRIFNNEFDDYVFNIFLSGERVFAQDMLEFYKKHLISKINCDDYSSHQKTILEEKLKQVRDLLARQRENSANGNNNVRISNISHKYRELENAVNDLEITKETLKEAGKYNFFDKDGNRIPQFIDERGKKTFDSSKYLDREGRLYNIIQTNKK